MNEGMLARGEYIKVRMWGICARLMTVLWVVSLGLCTYAVMHVSVDFGGFMAGPVPLVMWGLLTAWWLYGIGLVIAIERLISRYLGLARAVYTREAPEKAAVLRQLQKTDRQSLLSILRGGGVLLLLVGMSVMYTVSADIFNEHFFYFFWSSLYKALLFLGVGGVTLSLLRGALGRYLGEFIKLEASIETEQRDVKND